MPKKSYSTPEDQKKIDNITEIFQALEFFYMPLPETLFIRFKVPP